jgi:hypothetical protein
VNRLSCSPLSLRDSELHLKRAVTHLERASQLLQTSRELMKTPEGVATPHDEDPTEDRIAILDSADSHLHLSLAFALLSLRDWLRALRVTQRLLLSPSTDERVK